MLKIMNLTRNPVLSVWVTTVAKASRARGKGLISKNIVATLALCSSLNVYASPDGGLVVIGAGSITQTGATTTINQTTQNLSLNWESFNIAPTETVNFVQPSASAVAVNRIFDTNGTQILGNLNANGQVYLVNPNGILFGQGAQVNVGALVASTLDFNDANLNDSTRTFSGNSTGSIVNQGAINAASGGYIALLGNTVSNQGTITAPLGTVALGAGSSTTLTFQNNSLVKMQVDQSVLNSLAENSGLIRADGGLVLMSAGAKNTLLASVVNNTGVIEAHTMQERNGTIILLGGMTAGTANVSGTLDASAPNGGNGGFIETSAANVKIADDVKITTAAPQGNSGTWLIDPVDFTIAASGGDITGTALTNLLADNSITIEAVTGTNNLTNLYGSTDGNGDIHVNDAVSWSTNTLTLTAAGNININALMTVTGTAGLTMNTAAYAAGVGVLVGMSRTGFTGRVDMASANNLTINGLTYTLITTTTELRNLAATGNFALANNLDFTGEAAYTTKSTLGGNFNGLGHTVTDMRVATLGMISTASAGLDFRNMGLENGAVTSIAAATGGLIGSASTGNISNTYNTGSVTGGAKTGGLVGTITTTASIANSFYNGVATVAGTAYNVSGAAETGGLVGYLGAGSITNSHTSGSINGAASTGGLVGTTISGDIINSYSTASVLAASAGGGLVGTLTAAGSSISDSYATGDVTSTGVTAGGLLSTLTAGTVTNSYSTGAVAAAPMTGAGGLIGASAVTTVTDSYWDITTSGRSASLGGAGAIGVAASADMYTSATFTNWDFTNTWFEKSGRPPVLRSNPEVPLSTPLTVTFNNVTQAHNGNAFTGGSVLSYSGGVTASNLPSLTYNGTAEGAINVGTYGISGTYAAQSTYVITYVPGVLTITDITATTLPGVPGVPDLLVVQNVITQLISNIVSLAGSPAAGAGNSRTAVMVMGSNVTMALGNEGSTLKIIEEAKDE
jgi:filamentous hemagglutinin family protein